MAHSTILVVDDDAFVRWRMADRLTARGYELLEADTGAAALEKLPRGVDLVVLDHGLPDMDGGALLRKIEEFDQDIVVIDRPFDLEEVAATIDAALETTRLRREARHYRTDAAKPYHLHSIIGSSPSMMELREHVARAAARPASAVLLTGETGTGKDLVARVIHYTSERASRPFVNVTWSPLPGHLLEDELFGHEPGALTDARPPRRGLFDAAEGGTIYFDEIAGIPPALQPKLLGVLEEATFKRAGGVHDVHVDVRVVAATSRDLEAEVAGGRFRNDLFHRLCMDPIAIPPLRAHAEDVPLLVEHFIDDFTSEFRSPVLGASPAAYTMLERYGWPGNVRELRNVVERAMLLSDSRQLEARDFAAVLTLPSRGDALELPPGGISLEELERSLVVQALDRSGGNQTRAAALLGLNRDQVRYRIEKFGLAATH